MRIVFVAYNGSLHTRRWAGFFAARGHDVHVVTCGDAEVGSPDAPYEVHDLGAPRPPKAGYVLKVPRARSLIRSLAPDLVHAHFATSYGMLALASGERPLVVTAHGDDVLIAPRSRVLRPIVRRVLRSANLVTVPSDQMRDAVLELAPHADVSVFQYGVDVGRLAGVASSTPREEGSATRAVSARPLLDLYRHDVLLDALAILRDGGARWECAIYGDGPSRPFLEAQARQLGLDDRVTFHGRRSPDEVERALAAADVYVSVAESDGASLALLEALALGPVPVLSDIPANRAWVEDGVNGIITPIDPREVAASLTRAAALNREEVASRNRAVVADRADRTRNLTALEQRLELLVAEDDAGRRPGAR